MATSEREVLESKEPKRSDTFPPFGRGGKVATDLVASAVPYQQHDMVAYTTVLSPQDLVGRASVPTFDPTTGSGYQRSLNQQRVAAAAEYLQTTFGFFPGAIVLSVRGKDRDKLVYRNGKLTIPRNVRLHVVDGQTRLSGCWRASKNGADLSNFGLPAVILLTKSELDEAGIFRTIHREQKRVSTDLVDTILDKEIESGRTSIQKLEEMEEVSKANRAIAVRVMKMLSTTPSSPWFDRISVPNKDIFVRKTGDTSERVRASAFVGSLATIVSTIGEREPEEFAKIVQNYWEAIRTVCPTAWKDTTNYRYLHASSGVYVMNLALRTAYVEVLKLGGPTVKNFVTVLRRNLGDDFFASNGPLRGVGTWQSYRWEADRMARKLVSR